MRQERKEGENGLDEWSRQELLRDCDKSGTSWFALAADRSVVSRFGDSMYRGTSAKNEAQAVAMDQKKTCTATLIRFKDEFVACRCWC